MENSDLRDAIASCPKCYAAGLIGNLVLNPDNTIDCENCGKFSLSEFAACRANTVIVTPSMIAAGVRVLRASGALYSESSADHLVVREVLDAALHAT